MTTGVAHPLRPFREADVTGAEHRSQVSVAEWGQAFDLLDRLSRKAVERRLCVNQQFRAPPAIAEFTGGNLTELASKRRHIGLGYLQSRGRGVTAVAFQQFVALGERRVEV